MKKPASFVARAAACALALGALLAPGCSGASGAPTQLLLIVEGDEVVRDRADTLEVRIRGEKGGEVHALDPIVYGDDEAIAWPRRVVIVPLGGDADRRVRVEVAGFESGASEAFVEARVEAGFEQGETFVIRVFLEEACIGVACRQEQTCFEGACVDPGDAWPRMPYSADAGTMDAAVDGAADGAADGATPDGDTMDADADATPGDATPPTDADADATPGDSGPSMDADADATAPDGGGDGCQIDVDDDGSPEMVTDGAFDPNNPCQYCDVDANPNDWTAVVCEQVVPKDPCLVETGVCDPSLIGGTCEGESCCRFDPVWPEGSTDPQPACPLAGDDPDTDGELDPGEDWTGLCTHGGGCQGCTDPSQCDDSNACTADDCVGGTCTRDSTVYLGDSCTVSNPDDGVCTTEGSTAVCLLQDGKSCGGDGECMSGQCVDGYCCDSSCGGECERCDMAGREGTCSPDHDQCAKCEKCASDGTCTLQTTGEDLKDECTAAPCATGNCDGAGSCGVEPADTDCGTCQSCDGSGSCTPNSTDHEDCGQCDKCVDGTCEAQSAGEDLKGECSSYSNCEDTIAGWDGTDCMRFTGSSSLNGDCDGTGFCASLNESCTGSEATWSPGCTETACRNDSACSAGSSVSQSDELDELCYVDDEPGDCPSGQLCTPTYGDCEPTCNDDGDCGSGEACCDSAAPSPCDATSDACYCMSDTAC